MRLSVILLFVLTVSLNGWSQTSNFNVDLPQLLPASPEPSGFLQSGLGKANLSNGAVVASVPIHTIKVRDFVFPVSLDYSSQGLKVDEASSRVGTGWVLNATGMITRVVKGRPDEFAARLSEPAVPTDNTEANYNYYLEASNSQSLYDTQPDEFQFSFNGYSGKFVLDSNYVPLVTSASNLKISIFMGVSSVDGNISKIIIITPDGVKYEFGNAYEKTITHNVVGYTTYKDRTKTAFFLDKITIPTGEAIRFNYNIIQTEVVTGYSQTLKVNTASSGVADCQSCSDYAGYSSTENKIKYQTSYLTSIIAPYNPSISFNYEDRPDLTGDNRLVDIIISGLKKLKLQYYDVPGLSHNMGRYFLTALKQYKGTGPLDSLNTSDYLFSYNDLQTVPLPISFSQDYLGYYNGKNNSSIIPNLYNTPLTDFSHLNPDSNFSIKGVLKKIRYPTGGTEEFIVGGNTQAKKQLRNTIATEEIQGIGGTTVFMTYNSPVVEIVRTQTASLQLRAADANFSDGYTADSAQWTVKVDFYQGSNLIASRTSTGYNTNTMNVNLQAGLLYRWVMTVKASTEIGYSTLFYDTAAVDIYDTINVEIPGIRLNQIKFFDSLSNTSFSKFYTYASLNNLAHSTGSAWGGIFHSTSEIRFYCGQFYEYDANCQITNYSSSSIDMAYSYAGSGTPIYYTSVIESDHPNFINGGTEYQFEDNDPGSHYTQILGQLVHSVVTGQHPTLSGMIRKKIQFNSNLEIVGEEEYTHESVYDLNEMVSSMYVRSRYQTYLQWDDRLDAFDAIRLIYMNHWIRPKKVTTKRFSNGELLSSTREITYGTKANVLPVSESTKNSRGDIVFTEKKYPNDFPSDLVMQKLVTRNILTPVIQLNEKQNGNLTRQLIVGYKDWYNDTTVVLPDTSKIKRSPQGLLNPELIVNRYDSIGNVLELQKFNDHHYTYLWSTNLNLPLCEVKNGSFDQVAFTSFEEDSNLGNWQLQSGSIHGSSSFIGSNSFTGSLTKSFAKPTQGSYIVSLWTTASATVNGISGSQIKAHRGWKLMQWTLSNPTSITVSGTNLDDVRLHPAEAMMSTFNYKPFVGLESKVDENNNVTYFEYDGFERLYLVRDIDSNVVKKYCYNLQGKQEDCDYYSFEFSDVFTRNNCPSGYTASSVTYTVPARKYSSTISQQDANQKALDDLYANGQSYANANGTCTQYTCSTSNCTGIAAKCINNVCETGVRENLSSVWMKVDGVNWKWKCTWRYRWSDCSVSPEYVEYNDSSCPVLVVCGSGGV